MKKTLLGRIGRLNIRAIGYLIVRNILLNHRNKRLQIDNTLLSQRIIGLKSMLEQSGIDHVPDYTQKLKIPVQINGKFVDVIEVNVTDSNCDIEQAAMESEKVQSVMQHATQWKVVIIPGKLVNIVGS